MLTHQMLSQYFESINTSKKILVAYSGGLDSHVLLHLASQLPSYQVRAVHIHHGLLEDADNWPVHCEKICSELGIPLIVEHLNLDIKKGDSIEQTARIARYHSLKKLQYDDELLVTAHHQNDQTETFLLQLFRGAGVNGLAAMPSLSPNSRHARPLLSQSRESLEVYSRIHELEYIQDPSNKDDSFDRNFLRNTILPELRERWKGLDKAVGRSAMIQAETKTLLDEVTENDFQSVVSKDNTIDITKLLKLSFLRQKLVVRFWIKSTGLLSPSEKKLRHIFTDVINAGQDAQPLVEWLGAECRRFHNAVFVMQPLSQHDSSQVIIWNIDKSLVIESLGINLMYSDLNIETFISKNDQVKVSFRQGGERMFIEERGSHISLKNLMHEQGVPPWLRARLPLISINNEIVKVIGLKS